MGLGRRVLLWHAARESVSGIMPWMPWCHADYSLEEAQAWCPRCGPASSMAEMAAAGEDHRQAVLVGGGDQLVIAQRPSRLYDGARAGGGGGIQSIPEREEGVRCRDGPLEQIRAHG
jgi:hypothetical protein